MNKQSIALVAYSIITLASTTPIHAWREKLPYRAQYWITWKESYFENIIKDAVHKDDPTILSRKYNTSHASLFNKALSNGEYPLLYALRNNAFRVAHALIEMGAAVTITDPSGKTPLHLCRSAIIAQILIEKGAKVNAMNAGGRTPLHCAAEKDWPKETIDLLLAYKADRFIKDKEGRTPGDLAQSDDIYRILRIGGGGHSLTPPACSSLKKEELPQEQDTHTDTPLREHDQMDRSNYVLWFSFLK